MTHEQRLKINDSNNYLDKKLYLYANNYEIHLSLCLVDVDLIVVGLKVGAVVLMV